MAKNKVQLDPEKFAYAVINNYQSPSTDKERIAKDNLQLFLSTYFIASQFNELESAQFSMMRRIDFKALEEALKHTNGQ